MTELHSPDTGTQAALPEDHAPIAWRTPIQASVVYAGEHDSLPRRRVPVRDFVVSRSKERGQGWTLTRDGQYAGSFAIYEDALDVARHWARETFERDRTHEVRVMVEWMRGRLDIDAHYQPESERMVRSA